MSVTGWPAAACWGPSVFSLALLSPQPANITAVPTIATPNIARVIRMTVVPLNCCSAERWAVEKHTAMAGKHE
ncbi:hypothetical protein MVI01_00090 [Myxococcus virescens]|uniref:Uncharacterized protein n=1 Tax=Myxococcus virescens TaxID=83456 RepID=A0A511H3X0_9BACT|nr:hypothetical protein MVI01_00090 [Myxococcus virescens]